MDKFWAIDPYILVNKHKLMYFIPTDDMTTDEKLNAVMRFSIYLGVLLVIIFNSINYIYITLIAATLLYLVKAHYPLDETEGFVNATRELQQPTKNNPFMNVLISDYVDNPHRGPAADVEDPHVKKQINVNFADGLYKDINNIWDKNNSQRQYYTNPSTTIPNDRDSFMKWCYSTPFTCKDGNMSRCLKYEDVRNSGQVF